MRGSSTSDGALARSISRTKHHSHKGSSSLHDVPSAAGTLFMTTHTLSHSRVHDGSDSCSDRDAAKNMPGLYNSVATHPDGILGKWLVDMLSSCYDRLASIWNAPSWIPLTADPLYNATRNTLMRPHEIPDTAVLGPSSPPALGLSCIRVPLLDFPDFPHSFQEQT